MTHYSIDTADAVRVGGSMPLRKLARLNRRRKEAKAHGMELPLWLEKCRDADPGRRGRIILARMKARNEKPKTAQQMYAEMKKPTGLGDLRQFFGKLLGRLNR